MTSADNNATFTQILAAITELEGTLAWLDFHNYQQLWSLRLASERLLGIITEALIRLDNAENRLRYPDIDWDQARELNAQLWHHYDSLDDTAIWEIITNRIPKLKAIAQAAMLE